MHTKFTPSFGSCLHHFVSRSLAVSDEDMEDGPGPAIGDFARYRMHFQQQNRRQMDDIRACLIPRFGLNQQAARTFMRF